MSIGRESKWTMILATILLMLVAIGVLHHNLQIGSRAGGHGDQVESGEPRATKHHTSRTPLPMESPVATVKPEDSSPRFEDFGKSDSPVRTETPASGERPPHWKSVLPTSISIIPPGVAVSPPEVAVTVEGRRHMPRFQGSFSDRMEISAKGNASLSVAWPPEQKTDAILVSTINDGTINGKPGAVLKRGDDGRFRFQFQAGAHSGATQIVLTAANLSYTLNFWVPTGNPNVDPPALH